MTTIAAVAQRLGVAPSHAARWCAELGWSPGARRTTDGRPTLTVGRAVGLEVYGTLAQHHRARRPWRDLAHTAASLVDTTHAVRWIVHSPRYGTDHHLLCGDQHLGEAARYIHWHTRRGHQIIVVDLHHLAYQWMAGSAVCPAPSSPPSSSSPA